MFIGRKKELNKLDEMYSSNQFEFAVIYGRRRIGKTTLITEFCKNKKAIYYISVESTFKENLENLSRAVFEVLVPDIEMPAFDSFDKLLNFIDKYSNERIILAIDEYPYLAESDRSISSRLQAHIDQHWKHSKVMLILCGSSMSFMEYQVLGYNSPLYGRRTAQFKLQPFTYFETRGFAKQYSPEDQALLYGVTGGIPEYLARFSPKKNLSENIIDLFFTSSGMLFEEPTNLLKQELKNFAIYNAVIKAIAMGARRLNEIATKVGEDTAACANQVNALISLGIVKKEVPVTESETSRKTLYRLADSMFSFWYCFVSPNISNIERGMGATIYERKIKKQLSHFMGSVFEEICIQYMYLPEILSVSPFVYGNIGRWWGTNAKKKRQEEIDLLSVDGSSILLGECKWTNENVDLPIVMNLLERGELFSQNDIWYYIFAKNNFTPAVRNYVDSNEKIRIITFAEMNR